MKLKNKISGEIKEFVIFDGNEMQAGVTLKDLAQEWEDYEEPEIYFWIDTDGFIVSNDISTKDVAFEIFKKNLKSIGNYFETREEAEKAVEKLKAWKRLKDKGFKFTGWDRHPDFPGDFRITASDEYTCDDKDLDLLFGGEE